MPPKIRCSIDASPLKRALDKLEKKDARKGIRRGLRIAAKALAADVEAAAPVDTGRLQASVKVRAARRSRGAIAMEVVVTGGHDTPFVPAVEFGTRTQPGVPFMRPAFEAGKGPVSTLAIEAIKDAIEAAGK